MSHDNYVEQSADEIFSGPTHELTPSSYSSFHPQRRDSGFLHQRSSIDLPSSLGTRERSDSYSSFTFFSRDELQNVDGGSTVLGDDDPFESDSDTASQAPHHEPHVDVHTYYDDSCDDEQLLQDTAHGDFEYPSTRTHQRYYISEEDMRIVCAGYKTQSWRRAFYYVFSVCTLGIGYLLLRWLPRWRVIFYGTPSPLGKSDFVVIENQWGEVEFVDVTTERYNQSLSSVFNLEDTSSSAIGETGETGEDYVDKDPDVPYLRVFTYRYLRFLYNPTTDLFETNTDWVYSKWETSEDAREGLDSEKHVHRQQVFGKNTLEILHPPVFKLLVDEVLHPFYVFQVFSIILWLLDNYAYYATAIFVISVFSVAEGLYSTLASFKRLASVAAAETEIRVLRSGFWTGVSSTDLVPGDVFELSDPSLNIMPCDAMLLTGDCIVNESILTGESVPVSKVPATDKTLYNYVHSSNRQGAAPRSLLYSGTKLIRVREQTNDDQTDEFECALAMVTRIGFSTTKGSLLRSMVFPRPSKFKFYSDSFRYIGFMALIAIFGFIFSLISFIELHLPTNLIILRALDIITIVVPPALPATLTIGTNISLARLRKKNTFCITPSRINVGGRIDVVCFDKTGTLTEDGLDVLGVHPMSATRQEFNPLIRSATQLANSHIHKIIASCHELRLVDNEFVGDPLDVKMFEFCGWKIDDKGRLSDPEDPTNSSTLSVAKVFEFIPSLRRMGVVVTEAGQGATLHVKGAPEVMESLCKPQTLPRNYKQLLHEYTHRGFRVIACAYRELHEISDYAREDLERDLTFAGLIVFENKLKPTSRGVIKLLDSANIRTIMCTGDNVLTAISVGRECRILPKSHRIFAAYFANDEPDSPSLEPSLKWECVDKPDLMLDSNSLRPLNFSESDTNYSLAITGDVFGHLIGNGSREQLDRMLLKGAIYARMSPDEKHELVKQLQEIDYTTCFCGDGANDCGALKGADVGISLSEAEASVAAPFTSRLFEISCVIDVIKEGRCALSTSFSCFKYMSLYSAIQFFTVSILYSYGSNIGDFQFLWIDLFLIVPLAVFMAWSQPAKMLCKKRPIAKLVSHKVLIPLLGNMVFLGVFQCFAWALAHAQSVYYPPVPGDSEYLKSTYNTALFEISSFQYIFMAIVLCRGRPYRLPVHTNVPFLLAVLVTLVISCFFVFMDPSSFMGSLMDLVPTATDFKFKLLILAGVNFVFLYFADSHFFPLLSKHISQIRASMGVKKESKRYKTLIANERIDV